MKRYELKYIEKFNAFGVSDEQVQAWEKNQEIPLLTLSREDYIRLGCRVPTADSPTVAFLLGRNEDFYTAGWNDILPLARTEVNLCFLTYEHNEVQLQDCHALVLPGGDLAFPERYFADAATDEDVFPSACAKAYITSIRIALKKDIPMLGIAEGAQVIAGEMGVKLYRDTSHLFSPIKHNTPEPDAHKVHIDVRSPLYHILSYRRMVTVNSRHNVVLKPDFSQSHLVNYAYSTDGVPEAWGCYVKRILCVQWHLEDMVASKSGGYMQRIYDRLADRAWNYYDDQNFVFGW